MKKGWEYKKLGDVTNFINGDRSTNYPSKKDYVVDGIPFVNAGNLTQDGLALASLNLISISKYNSLTQGKFVEGDILFCLRGTLGKHSIVQNGLKGAIASSLVIIRPKDGFYNKYISYYLDYKQPFIEKLNNGAAQPNIPAKTMKEFSILLPPNEKQQQRIVSYLDSAFAKIDAMKANAENALKEAKALFQASLKEMMQPKPGWEEKKLNSLTTKIGSGATPKGGRKVYIEDGCHLIRSMNVQYNEFKYEDLAHITDEAADQLKGVEIQENDVLFNITGASIARCCVVPSDALPARVNQHVSILRLKRDILPRFLSYILNSPKHQKELLKIGETGSTRQALTKTDLENHVICYPNINIQTKILCALDAIKSRVDRLQSNFDAISRECDALKQAILREVFEGE